MDKDVYKNYLLEIRQGLKEAEALLKTGSCVPILTFRTLIVAKRFIHTELIKADKIEKNEFVIRITEG